MTNWLTRTNPVDLELRGDGRTLFGVVVPYDEPATISEGRTTFTERFAAGAFADLAENPSAVGRVKLLSQHDNRSNPLGRATEMREDPAGLIGSFRVSKTVAGDEALELVRDGALDAFSIGFAPVPGGDDWNADRTEVVRRAAKLREVSLVNWPAFFGAAIAGVRAARSLSAEVARRRLELNSL